MDRRAEIYAIAFAIPTGKVISYSDLGRLCLPPVSARRVGGFMSQLADSPSHNIPWWRVIGSNGGLPISKRDPNLYRLQREKLESEGIEFDDRGRVKISLVSTTDEEMISRIMPE